MWFQQWLVEIFMVVREFFFVILRFSMWPFKKKNVVCNVNVNRKTHPKRFEKRIEIVWKGSQQQYSLPVPTLKTRGKIKHINQWKNCSFIENAIALIFIWEHPSGVGAGFLATIDCIEFDKVIARTSATCFRLIFIYGKRMEHINLINIGKNLNSHCFLSADVSIYFWPKASISFSLFWMRPNDTNAWMWHLKDLRRENKF